MLADLALHRFGSREGLLEAIYGSGHAVPVVAAFSREVAAAAAQGDQLSMQIISDAGKTLHEQPSPLPKRLNSPLTT